jgi:hypothetical protein
LLLLIASATRRRRHPRRRRAAETLGPAKRAIHAGHHHGIRNRRDALLGR